MERGRILSRIVYDEAWKISLDVLEEEVIRDENFLMNCESTDPIVIAARFRKARSTRQLFERFMMQINEYVRMYKETKPEELNESRE